MLSRIVKHVTCRISIVLLVSAAVQATLSLTWFQIQMTGPYQDLHCFLFRPRVIKLFSFSTQWSIKESKILKINDFFLLKTLRCCIYPASKS